MRRKKVSELLQRFLTGRKEGRAVYFDADEIDELLDSFEDSDDFTYYDEVLALGLKLHPYNTDIKIRQCRAYIYNEQYDEALSLIESIADTDNQDLDMLRLECYAMMNEYKKVVEYTETLINHQCEYIEQLFEYIAQVLGDLEMNQEAHDFVNRGLMLFPDNLILLDELCFHLELEEDIPKAIKICNLLIDKNPYSHDYWFTLGRLHSIQGEYDKAIEAFDFALTCNDSDDELKILKAYCLYMNSNYEKAIEVYNEIHLTDENQTRIIPLLSECYVKMELYEETYKLLKDLKDKQTLPNDPSLYINYIRCCVELGYTQEASTTLFKAFQLFPTNVRILSLLAINYSENGYEQEAIKVTEQLFNVLDQTDKKKDTDIQTLFRMAQYLYMKGDIDKSIQYYQKVYETNPNMPLIHLHLAMAYLAKKDMIHFNEHYSQVSQKDLDDYLNETGVNYKEILDSNQNVKHIPPEDLVKEFLSNKDNNN
ncbi:MAG: tetratricopeptide repeat protein [Parabacteroides distasonis]|nr:tetratricopeptide repeat protein [Parabacteroides distasonis]